MHYRDQFGLQIEEELCIGKGHLKLVLREKMILKNTLWISLLDWYCLLLLGLEVLQQVPFSKFSEDQDTLILGLIFRKLTQ